MRQDYNPANADLLVNINGKLVHRDEAGVSPFDSSVQNGDAVWEGLRLYNGRIFKLQEHLDRLRKSAELLQYQDYPSDDELIAQLKRTRSTCVSPYHVESSIPPGSIHASIPQAARSSFSLSIRRPSTTGQASFSTLRQSGAPSQTFSTSTSTAVIN